MASTEEVISTLLADDYIHSSIQFLIDENMRTVTVPPEGVVLGVTGDKDVNRINFKMVRHYDGLDLSTFQIRINYVNANGDANYYQVTDTTVEDDSILFTWLVSSDAAAYKGTVSFAARLYTVEDTIVKESFNSTIATAEVLEGIIVDEYMPPDAQQDLIALLMSQIEFPAGSNVGQVDNTEGATAHGEIFNDYTHNEATGGFSHAEGNSTSASGANSHAEGSDTTASSNCTHAEGFSTTASKYYSHAEGSNTTASGTSSHAEGSGTTASGYYSHAEGSTTNATADTSHAEGSGTTASGYASHAEGSGTTATAGSSHAEGSGTKASSANQHVQGKYNVEDTTGAYAMIIGNGTSDDARSNALTVDWNGNVECGTINGVDVTQISSGGSGVGQVDATKGATYHGEIFNSYPDPDSHYVNSATGQYSHAEGFGTKASGDTSHAEGASTTASGNNSHAEGASTKATGQYSHAEGNGAKASGERSHAEGNGTTASGEISHAEGSSTTASAYASHAEGSSTTASGYYSHAEGASTTASGQCSHAEGQHTKASSDNQHVQGKFNVEDTANNYAMIIGNGYETFNTETFKKETIHSNALTIDWDGNIQCGKTDINGNFTAYGTINGVDITQISSGGSSGVGQVDATEGASYHGEIFNSYSGSSKNIATANFSHAEGYQTTTTGAGSHAEGYYTIASAHASHAEGYQTTASGAYAHSEGYQTTASETHSHAEGFFTKASSENQHVQGEFNVEDANGTYAMIIGNGGDDNSRSNALTIDWNGNIQCGKTDINGNFTTYGTINGVDITDLLNRIAELESRLTPVVENLFNTSMLYNMLTEGYITHNDTNYYYATVDSANNVISFIYDAKGMKILNDGALFESDTQYVIEADIKTSTASEGTNAGTSYNGCVEIQYSDKTKADALVNNTSEYTHVSYTTETGKTVSNLYVKGDMVAGLNVDTILYIKNLVIKKA